MSLKFSTEFTPQRIRYLRVIFDAATPGPWEALTRAVRIADFNMFVGNEDDTDFIIAARETFPEAIDRIEVLEMRCRWQKEAIQRVNAVLNKWHTEAPALDPLHRSGMSALVFRMVDEMQAALVHDDSEKADG